MTSQQGPYGPGVRGLRHRVLPAVDRLRDGRARADLLVAGPAVGPKRAPVGGEMDVVACGDGLVRVHVGAIVEPEGVHPHEARDEEGTTLTALLTEGLRLRLSDTPPARRRRRKLPVSSLGGGLQRWIDPSSNASLLDAADDGAAP